MKTKAFNKKLVFKKSTISKLNIPEMNELKGGRPLSALTICNTCNSDYPCYTLDIQCI